MIRSILRGVPAVVVMRRSTSLMSVRSKSSAPSSFVADVFSQLRWKAAHILTNGMSMEEKSLLMSKLDIGVVASVPEESNKNKHINNNDNDKNDNHDHHNGSGNDTLTDRKNDIEIQKTIGEAVAAARMAEAQRQQSKWDAERNFLLTNAEQAARARVENDLKVQERRLAMMRWQKDLEDEIARSADGAETTMTVETAAHPLLGPVVADLGYKKIYQVSAKTLATIPVWKKQRAYRHDRAKVIAADKMKTLHIGLPGILVLHEDADGKLSILDGQHRVGALALLSEKNPTNFDLEQILVEVFTSPPDTKDLAEEIFIEINKSEPIKLVDMPGVAKSVDRNLITQAAEKLQVKYTEMFRPSQQCRSPHLNVDNLRDAIFASDIIVRHGLKTSGALVNWLEEQNEKLRLKYEDADAAAKINPKALSKAQENKFFLGLESSWLYN